MWDTMCKTQLYSKVSYSVRLGIPFFNLTPNPGWRSSRLYFHSAI